MDVFFWAIDPRVAFWTRFEANFRLGGNQGPLFLSGLASPRVPGQLPILYSAPPDGKDCFLEPATAGSPPERHFRHFAAISARRRPSGMQLVCVLCEPLTGRWAACDPLRIMSPRITPTPRRECTPT